MALKRINKVRCIQICWNYKIFGRVRVCDFIEWNFDGEDREKKKVFIRHERRKKRKMELKWTKNICISIYIECGYTAHSRHKTSHLGFSSSTTSSSTSLFERNWKNEFYKKITPCYFQQSSSRTPRNRSRICKRREIKMWYVTVKFFFFLLSFVRSFVLDTSASVQERKIHINWAKKNVICARFVVVTIRKYV